MHQALLATDSRGRHVAAGLKGTRHLSLDNGAALERYKRTYRYDVGGNLVRTRHQGATSEWANDFQVDAASNRRWQVGGLGPGATAVAGPEAFDEAGNRIALPHLRALAWDHANRLTRAVVVDRSEAGLANDEERYVYGADSQRVRRVSQRLVNQETGLLERVETLYLDGCEIGRVLRGEALTLERTTSRLMFGDRQVALLHRWAKDDDAREVDADAVGGAGKIHYQVGDHLGSAALELDGDGKLISYEEYFPFGGSSFVTGRSKREVVLKEYRYSGKLRDDVTGFYYYGWRYYAPWMGGWLSPDPIGPEDGLNLYRFVRNNPVRFVDAEGLETVPDRWRVERGLAEDLKTNSDEARRRIKAAIDANPHFERFDAGRGQNVSYSLLDVSLTWDDQLGENTYTATVVELGASSQFRSLPEQSTGPAEGHDTSPSSILESVGEAILELGWDFAVGVGTLIGKAFEYSWEAALSLVGLGDIGQKFADDLIALTKGIGEAAERLYETLGDLHTVMTSGDPSALTSEERRELLEASERLPLRADEATKKFFKAGLGGVLFADQVRKFFNSNNAVHGSSSTSESILFSKRPTSDPMSPQLFAKIKDAFRRQGKVIDDSEDALRYLESRDAEAVTFNADTILVRPDASASTVFEELIHTSQHRTGKFRAWTLQYGTPGAIAKAEYEAAKRLVKNQKAYRISDAEHKVNITRVEAFREDLERLGIDAD